MRTLLIRADADTQMGTGHVMRCLALAQAWAEAGGAVVFLSSHLPKGLRQRVTDAGFSVLEMDRRSPDPQDLEQTLRAVRRYPGAWAVVDGYHFDQEYQSALRASDVPLLVIDDGLHLDRHWNVDLLLNQNLGAETLPYACTPDTRCLLGTRYVLLRREFRHVAQRLHRGSGHACRVLVSLGGGDPDNQTLKVMKGIEETGRRDLEVKVVVGTANLHVDSLRAAMERSAVPTHILQDVKDMPDLMAWADVAVSAGGSTCWELAYMGVPNLIVVTADNQLRIARALHLAGVSENLGWFEGLTAGRISGALLSLLADAARMEAMIRQGQTMVDGQGPVRVVDAMVEAA